MGDQGEHEPTTEQLAELDAAMADLLEAIRRFLAIAAQIYPCVGKFPT